MPDHDFYHDESRVDGYWHGILLVPRRTRSQLVGAMTELRLKTGWSTLLSFKDVDRLGGSRAACASAWLQLGAIALMREFKGEAQVLRLRIRQTYDRSERRLTTDYDSPLTVHEPIGARFIVFRERDDHDEMDSSLHPDRAARVETTLRFAVKGGLHHMFSESEPVSVRSLHVDGHLHHSRRRWNSRRVLEPLRRDCRTYVSIPPELVVNDAQTGTVSAERPDIADHELLQLADLLVGAFRCSMLGTASEHHRHLASPIDALVEKWRQGPARMKSLAPGLLHRRGRS